MKTKIVAFGLLVFSIWLSGCDVVIDQWNQAQEKAGKKAVERQEKAGKKAVERRISRQQQREARQYAVLKGQISKKEFLRLEEEAENER